ncbi:MAG TPA: 50S ribosomal protein L25 [Sandaracinaceae bacterium]
MEPQTLSAEVRHKGGKGPARQLRARGLIPAIFYGPGTEPLKLAVSPQALEKTLTGEYGRNQLLELDVAGEKKLAVVRDLEIDPVTRRILHVDFYSVARDRKVDTIVPFEVQGRAAGVQRGGFLRKVYRELPIRAFPQDVPAAIVLDVSPLDIGDAVRVADLPLPPGVEVRYPADRRVLFIDAKERRRGEEEAGPAAAAS